MSEPDSPLDFAVPFRFDSQGEAVTVVLNSPEDIVGCVVNVCSCIIGEREDNPDFGIPDVTFQNVPVDIESIQDAIVQWEPLATGLSIIEIEQAFAAARQVIIEP